MKIIRDRFPNKKNTLQVFFAVTFPIHIWAIVVTLQRIPTYLLYLKISETIGIVSYTLAIVFVESLLITLIFTIIAAVLPPRFFKDEIVARSAILTPIALVIAYIVQSLDYATFFRFQEYIPFRYWLLIWFIGLIPILIVSYLVGKYQKLTKLLVIYVYRITILSQVYVSIDLMAVGIIIWRNIFPSS